MTFATLKLAGQDVPIEAYDEAEVRLSEGFGVLDSLTITWDPRSVGKWAAMVALGMD